MQIDDRHVVLIICVSLAAYVLVSEGLHNEIRWIANAVEKVLSK